jgi:predicted nucleotide-binding protein
MANWKSSGKWVAIVGTGHPNSLPLPEAAKWMTIAVAKALARAGHGLAVGDWPGVDFVAAQAFSTELHSLNVSVEQNLKQFAYEGSLRHFADGEVINTKNIVISDTKKLRLASFVILIGGVGGAYEFFELARVAHETIFPIAGTNGDAERAFSEMLANWNKQPLTGISEDEFCRLGKAINTEADANEIAGELEQLIDKVLKSQSDATKFTPLSTGEISPQKTKVFIVHGHDELIKSDLEIFLREIGLQPVVLHREADGGRTIIEKFEKYSNVGYAFILLTPDDIGYPVSEEGKPDSERKKERRARQNVIFELGYFVAKLGRQNVCCLYKQDVALPSDISGIAYKKFQHSFQEVTLHIIKDLKQAGFHITL